MANSLLCALPWFFLGGGLLGLLFWLPGWWWRDPPRPRPWPEHPFGILWLTAKARQALGDCAAPGRLRRITDKAIARRLHGFTEWGDEAVPTEAHWKTWQKQAGFICRGDYDGLLAYQRDLLDGDDGPVSWSRPILRAPADGPMPKPDTAALILAATLLLLALILFLIADRQGWCRCEPEVVVKQVKTIEYVPIVKDPDTEIVTTTLNLPTDMFFPYNKSELNSAEQRRIAVNLAEMLEPFSRVRVKRIGAYTDPIGTTDKNKELADKRAASVRAILQQVISDAPAGRFAADLSGTEMLPIVGPNPNDQAIWQQCFNEFFVQKLHKPLVRLTDDQRPECRAPGAMVDGKYPACARPRLPARQGTDPVYYSWQAENFRELTSCLAPMRRVAIVITSERDEYKVASKKTEGE